MAIIKQLTSWLEAASREPWAILEETLQAIYNRVQNLKDGEILTDDEIAAFIGVTGDARETTLVGSIAYIPIMGMLTARGGWWSIGANDIADAVEEAAEDEDITAIVLDVDSPGGSVRGIPEAAETIRRARDKKPVVAMVTGRAASAAYWLASAATEIVVTPSGEVGGIGIFMAHLDISKAFEKRGYKVTFISAGKHKTEGNPYEPLGEKARAAFQKDVDAYYAMFVNGVAAGRGISAGTVEQKFGQGRMKLAADALAAGMVNRIGTMNDTMLTLLRAAQRGGGTLSAVGTPRELEALLRDVGRMSNSEAKRIASLAFKMQTTEPAPRDEGDDSAAIIRALDACSQVLRPNSPQGD